MVALVGLIILSGLRVWASASSWPQANVVVPSLGGGSDVLSLPGSLQTGAAPSAEMLSGPQKTLILTVEFPDLTHARDIDETVAELNRYWQDVSYGKISLDTTMASKWYVLTRPLSYYGQDPETTAKKIEFIYDAFKATGKDYNYGQYSYVVIVHAGDDQARSWNKADMWDFGTIGRAAVMTDFGSVVVGVTVVAEMDPVGAYAHEMGHNFGLPDLWNYEVVGTICPYCDDFVGEWDLMAHGSWAQNGTMPAELSSWSRLKLGWLHNSQVTEVKVGNQAQGELRPLEASNPAVFKITITDTTYYLVEVRKKARWDRGLPDEGVLIFYVDDTKGSGDGPVRYKTPSGGMNSAWKQGQFFVDQTNKLIISIVSADASFNFKIALYTGSMSGTYDLTVHTPYPNLTVILDGKQYTTSQGGEIVLKGIAFGVHTLSVQAIKELWPGTRAVFGMWSDQESSNPRTVLVTTNTNMTALYKIQYFLAFISQVPVNGSGWYDANSQASFRVDSIVDYGNGTRRVLAGWGGDYTGTTPSGIVVMNGPKTITADWRLQYQLTVASLYGSPQGGGWYDAGKAANVSVTVIVEREPGVRERFAGWSGDASRTGASIIVVMDGPKSLRANWETQHLVSVQFMDANGEPILQRPLTIKLDHAGSTVDLNQSAKMWLDSGDYTLLSAEWHGVDIANAGAKYSTSPNGVWQVGLQVYAATVHIKSIITGLPVKGAQITLRLPDDSTMTATTDMSGTAVFPQLPNGRTYPALATAQFLTQGFTVSIQDGNVDLTVKMPVTTEIAVIIAPVIIFMVLRRRAKPTEKKSPRLRQPGELRDALRKFRSP